MKLQSALILACAAVGLTACDGGHNYDDPVTPPPTVITNQVPSSATVSTKAYKDYAQSLAKSETALPLDVNSVKPPTSETEAPLAL